MVPTGALAIMWLVASIPNAAPTLPANVRPMSGFAQQALSDGIRRSPTLAALIHTIGARGIGDAIVYIDARIDASLPTAETTLVSAAGRTRFLRIVLNPAVTLDRRVELLGHELQHALEIMTDSSVRDGQTLRRRFGEIGRESAGSTPRLKAFETEAARGVSIAIRRELAQYRR
jgi:hypothetical protein